MYAFANSFCEKYIINYDISPRDNKKVQYYSLFLLFVI